MLNCEILYKSYGGISRGRHKIKKMPLLFTLIIAQIYLNIFVVLWLYIDIYNIILKRI